MIFFMSHYFNYPWLQNAANQPFTKNLLNIEFFFTNVIYHIVLLGICADCNSANFKKRIAIDNNLLQKIGFSMVI